MSDKTPELIRAEHVAATMDRLEKEAKEFKLPFSSIVHIYAKKREAEWNIDVSELEKIASDIAVAERTGKKLLVHKMRAVEVIEQYSNLGGVNG